MLGKKQCLFAAKEKKKMTTAPLSFSFSEQEEIEKDDCDIVVIFFLAKEIQKIRKDEEKGAYLQTPTSSTTLKLLLLGHS